MARKSKIQNPAALTPALKASGYSASECIAAWAKALGITQEAAKDDLIRTGFYRELALETARRKNA